MVNSRQKGKRGELEACHYLKEQFGISAIRSQQYCGRGGDSADIISAELPTLHFEIKRVQALNMDKAMEQAKADCPDGKVPVVMHRKDRQPWKVTIELTRDNINILKGALDSFDVVP
jgi:hypothetical protein